MIYIASLGFFLSFILFCSILFFLYLGKSSYRWSRVDARLIVSEVKEAKEYLKFDVIVRYEYMFNNITYSSSRVGYFTQSQYDSKKTAEAFLDKVLNSRSIVYAHPLLKGFSVILPGLHNKRIFNAGLALSIFGIGFFGFLLYRL